MTKDGSVSDLRSKTEKEKCSQSRIMTNQWRGALNDIITVLGIMLAWQTFFTCDKGRCESRYFPGNQVMGLFDGMKGSTSKTIWVLMLLKVLFIEFGMVLIPTYANYINTSYQHGRMKAKDYGLPDCYDDPEDIK